MESTKKVALITGVSRGIGKAICQKLIEEGYFVHGTYNTSTDEVKELQKECDNLKVYQVDFSNRKATMKFLEEMRKM